MFIKLENLKIYYKVSGNGKPIVLLHGWGSNVDCFVKLQEHLSQKFTVYAIDLPGFGLSTTPTEIWGSIQYANLIKLFIDKLHIVNPILLGHSFGGKIAINLIAHNLVTANKVILIDSSGIILPKPFKINCRIYFFKLLKFFASVPIIKNFFSSKLELYKKKFGSRDYRNADGIMRAILVKTVNESIVELLPQLKVSTLLLWGEQDDETPLKAGIILHNALLNSQLKIISGSGHFPFLDNWEKVKIEIDSFLN